MAAKIDSLSDDMRKIIFQLVDTINQTNFTKLAIDGIQQGTTKEQILTDAFMTVKEPIE